MLRLTLWSKQYDDVIMIAMGSQITSLTSVYSNVYSGTDESKHQSSMSLAFVRGIHRWPVNSPHKWPVTRKIFPFDDVIMYFPLHTGDHEPAVRVCMECQQVHNYHSHSVIYLKSNINSLNIWKRAKPIDMCDDDDDKVEGIIIISKHLFHETFILVEM